MYIDIFIHIVIYTYMYTYYVCTRLYIYIHIHEHQIYSFRAAFLKLCLRGGYLRELTGTHKKTLREIEKGKTSNKRAPPGGPATTIICRNPRDDLGQKISNNFQRF